MPDYIYLLENRLSPDQQHALKQVREASREAGMTVFLAGGAVRDLTSGSPVRDLTFPFKETPSSCGSHWSKQVPRFGANIRLRVLFSSNFPAE